MWQITKDCLEKKKVTKCHSRNFDGRTLPYRFRLLDDDKEVYFYGKSNDCDSEAAFAPLDNFGEAFGCTDIQYRRNGKWESL